MDPYTKIARLFLPPTHTFQTNHSHTFHFTKNVAHTIEISENVARHTPPRAIGDFLPRGVARAGGPQCGGQDTAAGTHCSRAATHAVGAWLACKQTWEWPQFRRNRGAEWSGRRGNGPVRPGEASAMSIIVEGFKYDPKTKGWTERVQYEARDRIEAIRWMNFQRDWLRGLRIIEDGARQ